jgi:hypothetical protein
VGTLGTWVDPTLVQPIGGLVGADLLLLGTPQSVSRTNGATYYNTTGRWKFCSVMSGFATDASTSMQFYVNGQIVDQDGIGRSGAGSSGYMGVQGWVPPNGSYSCSSGSGFAAFIEY